MADMGYPLPAGDAFEEDLACMILFYPDRPEYRQALFGSLDYLATWIAWERDDDKRGIDAGRAWALAVLATRECVEMNTCETILSLLTQIEANTGVYCCDVVDISDGDQYTDEVEDGVGDVPQNIVDAGYAEDTSDWAGFDDYKCLISNLMVENMQAQTATFLSWTDGTEAVLVTVAAVAAVALAIATAGGAVLVYGIALSVAGVAGLYAGVTLLGSVGLASLVDNLEDHYNDLVCAIYEADGSSGAVVALKDAIDEHFNVAESAYLKNLNLGPQLKALYAGRYDQQDIAQIMADKGYDPGDYFCNMCGVEPLDVGANLEIVEVTAVNAYGGSGGWTIHAVDEDYANGVEIDVTHTTGSGNHFYVELDLAPSAYHTDPDADFRGLTYLAFHTATGTEQNHVADAGAYVQVGSPVGYGRIPSWFALHSDPYPEFRADCEDILENTYAGYVTTNGLSLLPDQTRKILLRFTVNGIQRYFIRIHTLQWSIDYQP